MARRINNNLYAVNIFTQENTNMNDIDAYPGLYYRRATNTDGEYVRKIVFDALTSYGLVIDPAATDVDLFDIEQYYPDGTFWVLVDDDDTIKGSFAFYRIDETTAEVRKMYFDPSIRGRGLGTWAMHFLIKEAQNRGYQTLNLETASVLKEAISLYKKLDFKTIPGSCHSHRCDVVMEKRL